MSSVLDLPDVPHGQLPENLQLQRTRVVCASDAPIHTEGVQYSGAYTAMGIDNSLRLDNFCNNFRIEVTRLDEDEIEFDMVGIDASLANAFRRILIAELPTMAIEKVLVANNTSVVQDEVLAHRLGLIPIKVDPRLFEYISENDTANEKNTIVFSLNVKCNRGDPRLSAKSDQLKWLPNGSELLMASSNPSSKQKTYSSFTCSQDSLPAFSDNPIGPKHPDILIAKLGPGQEIELEAHAVKGVGKTHAKWSPVSTAWYRMLPEVVLLKDIEDVDAEKLVKKCPVKVFDIEDIGKGRKKAKVARPRACTLCRECIREDGWDQLVQLRRVKDHFICFFLNPRFQYEEGFLYSDSIRSGVTKVMEHLAPDVTFAIEATREIAQFRGKIGRFGDLTAQTAVGIMNPVTIESTGALPPEALFTEAVKILEDKCERVMMELS